VGDAERASKQPPQAIYPLAQVYLLKKKLALLLLGIEIEEV
jgi:hypothetical protein